MLFRMYTFHRYGIVFSKHVIQIHYERMTTCYNTLTVAIFYFLVNMNTRIMRTYPLHNNARAQSLTLEKCSDGNSVSYSNTIAVMMRNMYILLHIFRHYNDRGNPFVFIFRVVRSTKQKCIILIQYLE